MLGNLNFHRSTFSLFDNSQIFNDEMILLEREKILKNTESKNFYINYCHEPWNGDTENYTKSELLKKNINNFYILTGNINYWYYTKDKIIFQPQSYLETRFNKKLAPVLSSEKVINSDRQHLISCYNGRSRVHRIENYILLKEKPYFNKFLFSMHNDFDIEQEKIEWPGVQDLDPGLLAQWENERFKLPNKNVGSDWSAYDKAYRDTYIAYVTETSINSSYWFWSEKIWRPIMAGQLFLFLAYPNSVQHLRDLGFDVYDDIIDNSYDKEQDWHKRITMLHQEIERLLSLNLVDIFKNLTERRLRNYNYFYSKKFFNLYTKHLPENSLNLDLDMFEFHNI